MSSVVTTYPARARHAHRAQRVADAVVSAYIREITPTAPRSERLDQPEPPAPSVPAWADAPAASLAISPRRTWTRRTSRELHDAVDSDELEEDEPEEPESEFELLELVEESFLSWRLLGPSAESLSSRARLRVP